MQVRRTVLIALLAAGCHKAGSSNDSPDASSPDAFILSDAETSPGCDFVQRGAATQFDYETIPFDYTGQTFTVCGEIDGAGYSTMYKTHSPKRIDSLMRVDFDAPVAWWGGTGTGGAFSAYGRGTEVHVDAQHEFVLSEVAWDSSSNGEDDILIGSFAPFTDAPVHYKATISPFDQGTLCPAVTTPTEYTEAHDGSDSSGNDVFVAGAATAATTDAPEPTGLTIDAGSAHRISGTTAFVKAGSDGIHDPDTYAITTGADTHFLYVRPTPQSSGQAYMLFALTKPDLASIAYSGNAHDGESLAAGIGVFAVEPSTTYWLQIGAALNGTAGSVGLPLSYDISICGAQNPPSP